MAVHEVFLFSFLPVIICILGRFEILWRSSIWTSVEHDVIGNQETLIFSQAQTKRLVTKQLTLLTKRYICMRREIFLRHEG